MATHIETGLEGESLAAAYLEAQGWEILSRRWRDGASGGVRTDVDLVARSADGVYHFVEVKTRSGDGQGDYAPENAVDAPKIDRMIAAAERYMTLRRLDGEVSVDLIAILVGRSGATSPMIRYYPNIVR